MFLGLTYAGDTDSASSTLSQDNQVDVLEIKNAHFDVILVTNKIYDTFDGTFDTTWTFDTRLYTKLEGNLYGGNVNFTESIVEQVRIKKKTSKDSKFQTIFEKPINTKEDLAIEFIDYLEPVDEVEYAYVSVISDAEDNYITNSVKSKFDYYFLVDNDTSYPCILNVVRSDTYNYGATAVKPLNRKYPITVVNGITGYRSGTFECIFLNLPCDGIENDGLLPYQYRDKIIQMLTNGQPKLIKSYEGELFMINITDNIEESERQAVYDGSKNYELVTNKFSWVECADPYDAKELNYNGFTDVTTF